MRSDGGVIHNASYSPTSTQLSPKNKGRIRQSRPPTDEEVRQAGPRAAKSVPPDGSDPLDLTEADAPFPIPEDPERELTGQVSNFGLARPPRPCLEEQVPCHYRESLLVFD